MKEHVLYALAKMSEISVLIREDSIYKYITLI